jgi:glycosyltransferase involved in cell wall biosynthesis
LAFQLGFAEDAVELRGYVGSDELANLYRTAEIVLVPSLAEGFSIPVAEAVTRGVPVVASEIPAHRELLGEGPWLAAGTDIRSLAAALAYVLAHRADVVARQRCALGDAATPHRVQDRIEDSLRLLLAATAKPETLRRPRGSSSSRPRIALVSPFPPQRSGVADYTAFTFGHVANYADVAVYSDAFRTDTDRPVPVKPLSSEPYLSRDFDVVVNIIGNSHFHLPILDLLGSYGGATVAHDNRMLEAYRLDRGDTWVARLLSGSERAVAPYEIGDFLSDLDRLPSIGYEFIVRQSSPLIVHGRALAERIAAETGVRPAVVPFVPYRVPDHPLDDATRRRVRGELGLSEGVRHIGTFGIVDRRTKGTDLIIGAIAWLRQWGSPARLHVVGGAVETELEALESLAAELDVSEHVRFYGHVSASDLTKFLQAVDVAVQLRTSGLLSLSGSVADCIAFGLPTVTSRDVAEELDVPSYVVETAPQTSSLLVAEAIAKAVTVGEERRNAIESERREYLDRRSPDEYAKQLLDALDLSVARRA